MRIQEGDICVDGEGVVVKIFSLENGLPHNKNLKFIGRRVDSVKTGFPNRAAYYPDGRAQYNRKFDIVKILHSSTSAYSLEE
jgi:hypothetical protein